MDDHGGVEKREGSGCFVVDPYLQVIIDKEKLRYGGKAHTH